MGETLLLHQGTQYLCPPTSSYSLSEHHRCRSYPKLQRMYFLFQMPKTKEAGDVEKVHLFARDGGTREQRIIEVLHGNSVPFPLTLPILLWSCRGNQEVSTFKGMKYTSLSWVFDHFNLHLEPRGETHPFNLLHMRYQGDWRDIGYSGIQHLEEKKINPNLLWTM